MTKRALTTNDYDQLDFDAMKKELRAGHLADYTKFMAETCKENSMLVYAFVSAVLSHDIVAVNKAIQAGLQENFYEGEYPFDTGEDNPTWMGSLFSFEFPKKRDRAIRLKELKALEDDGFLFVVIGMLIRENYWAPELDATYGWDGEGMCSAEKAGLLRVRDFLSSLPVENNSGLILPRSRGPLPGAHLTRCGF